MQQQKQWVLPLNFYQYFWSLCSEPKLAINERQLERHHNRVCEVEYVMVWENKVTIAKLEIVNELHNEVLPRIHSLKLLHLQL